MMKRIFAVALIAAATLTASAQNGVGEITVQPRLGMNIATLTKGGDGADCRVGLNAGAEFEFGLTDMVGLSAGLNYSMQGMKGEDHETLKLDYINVPILANVYVAKGLAVKLGVQPGFNVNAKAHVKEGGVSASADVSDQVKTVDFSIPVGVSYEIQHFVVDARYNWGLTKTLKDAKEGSKNSVFQITLGYKFTL